MVGLIDSRGGGVQHLHDVYFGAVITIRSIKPKGRPESCARRNLGALLEISVSKRIAAVRLD